MIRNKIVIKTLVNSELKKIKINNFSSLQRVYDENGILVIRIQCFNGKVYDFITFMTSLEEIQIYE